MLGLEVIEFVCLLLRHPLCYTPQEVLLFLHPHLARLSWSLRSFDSGYEDKLFMRYYPYPLRAYFSLSVFCWVLFLPFPALEHLFGPRPVEGVCGSIWGSFPFYYQWISDGGSRLVEKWRNLPEILRVPPFRATDNVRSTL